MIKEKHQGTVWIITHCSSRQGALGGQVAQSGNVVRCRWKWGSPGAGRTRRAELTAHGVETLALGTNKGLAGGDKRPHAGSCQEAESLPSQLRRAKGVVMGALRLFLISILGQVCDVGFLL